MTAAVAAPVKAKSTKAKKATSTHPPYFDMVKHAIKDLKERNGSSRQAIAKYIKAHYKVDDKVEQHLRRALVSAVKSGKLQHTKGIGASGSFKLAEKAAKVAIKPKSPKAKRVKKAAKPKTPKPATAKKPKVVKAKKPKKATTPKKKTMKPKRPVAKKTPKKVVKKAK